MPSLKSLLRLLGVLEDGLDSAAVGDEPHIYDDGDGLVIVKTYQTPHVDGEYCPLTEDQTRE